MKKLITLSLICISMFFGIQNTLAQSKQGHPFTAEELTKLQSKTKSNKAQKAPFAITASNKTFNMDSIQYWVGTGSKRAAMGIQWKNDDNSDAYVMVWGYRWENDADGTGERMLRAIAEHDARLYVLLMGGTQYGSAIGGLGYDRNFNGNVGITKGEVRLTPENGVMASPGSYNFDGWSPFDADDYWFSGWYSGFLTYMVRGDFTEEFSSSNVGATTRKLTDGNWDVWVANPGFSWITDESINSKFIPAPPTPNYSQGTFIVNEDWFGHNNSTVNFLSTDGTWTYRAFRKENPGHELGATSQYGTIYGGKMFIVSKQEKDPGAIIEGSRLAVADAKTMKLKAEFTTVGGPDGRSFLGVNDTLGYIGTSGGIYLFDIKNLKVGSLIEGTAGSGGLYSSQIGTMLRVGNRVFAVWQGKGILVIDALTNVVETTIAGKYGSIVMSKDGKIWASTDESANAGKTLVRINPYSLETENFTLPVEASIPNSWYAWTADGFCASNQTNSLYWKNNGGWFASKKIYKFDASNPTAEPVVIYESTDEWGIYGAGFRVNPLTDEIFVSMYKNFGDQSYKVIKLDGNGTLLAEYPMDANYWFPAMPVFLDNFAPVINTTELKKISFKDKFEIYLGDKITDQDNFNAGIVKSFVLSDNELADVKISGDTLYFTSKGKLGNGKLTLTANSNGKVVSTVIDINVIDAPQITLQPENQDVVVGEKATFKVEATGGDLSYQWYRDNVEIKYATSATYSINSTKLADNGAKFNCVVKNSLGEVVSEKVTLTTKLIIPEITAQPSSFVKAVKQSGTTSFRVTARGGELTYQWYKDGETISGATGATYSITSTQLTKDKSGEYHCVVTNAKGSTSSEKATLSVLEKIAITTQPENVTVVSGSTATFIVEVTGDNPEFQWFKDGAEIAEANEATLTINSVSASQAGEYHCIVKNAVSSVTSSSVTLTVSPTTGIENSTETTLIITPNPATAYTTINVSGQVAIYSVSGTKVYENTNYTAGTEINVSSFAYGIYIVKVNGETLKMVKK